ncbi:MAG: membrane protein of unknown function [Nitrospira sp.]|nr:MAG: membrane protein of unknown function [Nitrospira sp.]
MQDLAVAKAGFGQQTREARAMPLLSLGQIWCMRLVALSLVLCSAWFAWRSYLDMGLFMNFGTDYALYFAQSKVLDSSEPSQIYNLAVANQPYRDLLDAYNRDPIYRTWTADPIVGPVPYPPIFAWSLQPFTWLSPPLSFALWISLNVCVALAIGWRVANYCGQFDRTTVILLFLGSYPVALSLYVGQIQILLAWCVTEFFLALRAGKDFKAGMWLGCLLLKPQYGVFLGLLLLWKRRWMAVSGVAVTGSMIFGGSILVGGLSGIVAYSSSFSGMAQFRGDDPTLMINWRSLILDIYPTIYGPKGTLLTIALALVTAASLAWIWRGPWTPEKSDFPVKMLLTILGTLIASFHSHPYGAVFIALPLAAVLLGPYGGKLGWGLIGVGIVVPALTFSLGYSVIIRNGDVYSHLVISSKILKLVIFAMFGYFFVQVWRFGSSRTSVCDLRRGLRWDRIRSIMSASRLKMVKCAPRLVHGVVAAGVVVFMWQVSDPPELFSDFNQAYYPAGRAILDDVSHLYDRVPDCTGTAICGYVNLPLVALAFAPLSIMSVQKAQLVFGLLSCISIIISVVILMKLSNVTEWRRVAILWLFVLNGPLYYSLREGNLTHIALLLLLVVLLCLEKSKEWIAGGVLAVAAIIKLPLGLLGLYFFLKGRWKVVSGFAVTCIFVALASIAWFGWELHILWYREAILPFSNKALGAFNVQSIDGFLLRLGEQPLLYDWQPIRVERSYMFIKSGVAGLLLLASVVMLRNHPGASGRDWMLLEFSAVLCLALIISPISWTHYYLFLLLPLCLYLGGRLPIPQSRAWFLSMLACVLLISPPVVFLGAEPSLYGKVIIRLVTSLYFFGALCLWGVLCLAKWRTVRVTVDVSPVCSWARGGLNSSPSTNAFWPRG